MGNNNNNGDQVQLFIKMHLFGARHSCSLHCVDTTRGWAQQSGIQLKNGDWHDVDTNWKCAVCVCLCGVHHPPSQVRMQAKF